MHYLIDGHNLIARLPDIELDDPDDEAKLVLRLRRWTAAGQKRLVTVFFDGGLPGGEWRRLSSGRVKPIFATADGAADALLIDRVRQARNPSAYTLITSDQQILAVAKARRMPHLTSEAFARQLVEFDRQRYADEGNMASPPPEDPILSPQEVDEWLDIFRHGSGEK